MLRCRPKNKKIQSVLIGGWSRGNYKTDEEWKQYEGSCIDHPSVEQQFENLQKHAVIVYVSTHVGEPVRDIGVPIAMFVNYYKQQ